MDGQLTLIQFAVCDPEFVIEKVTSATFVLGGTYVGETLTEQESIAASTGFKNCKNKTTQIIIKGTVLIFFKSKSSFSVSQLW